MSEGGRSSLGGAQFGTRYRDCIGKTDQAPLCAMNFQHFIIDSSCENGGVEMLRRNYAMQTLHPCAHKCERQA
jgi:hypothetical protein